MPLKMGMTVLVAPFVRKKPLLAYLVVGIFFLVINIGSGLLFLYYDELDQSGQLWFRFKVIL